MTVGQASLIGSIFELAGVLVLGQFTFKTLREDILDPFCFEGKWDSLALGMLCASSAAMIWMMLATFTVRVIGCANCGFHLGASLCVEFTQKKNVGNCLIM